MKIRGIFAIIFSMSLALFAGNSLADSKSGSQAKSEKSSMPGNGYGHCKSDNSGKGHGKGKGNGHSRDCKEPPVLVCFASVERNDLTVFIPAEGGGYTETVSINFSGNICDIEPNTLEKYNSSIELPSESKTCSVSSEIIGAYTTSETEFWYPIDVTLECENSTPN